MMPGQIIAGRFLIDRVAGRGGMGHVYRGLDRRSGAPVAIKLLAEQVADPARFDREAALLSELQHPRIVRYIAHGRTEAGQRYLAMEWLEGEDLEARLARAGEGAEGRHARLGAEESVRLALGAAEALGALHERGLLHRDVKPSNLFLVGGEVDGVKLIDLGLARAASDPRRTTRAGAVVGTPGYMAPEQARGDLTVDARADVFALGCVLYECLTGRPAFAGEHVLALLARILLDELPCVSEIVPGIPAALGDLVARMLAKSPHDRPRHGHEVAEALASIGVIKPERLDTRAVRRDAITRIEQRVLSVLLIDAAPDEDSVILADAATLVTPQGRATPSELLSIARDHGARLDPLAGGAVLITLSGRGAATDHAARAARCALAILDAAPRARAALCTGRAEVAGSAVTGEVFDRASRLLGAAGAGAEASSAPSVRLDEVTAALLDARFDVRPGPLGLELRGERDRLDATRPLLGRPTPCVGRAREIGMLEAILAEAREERTARAVLVTAPPGTGKSRLLHELLRRQRAQDQALDVWMGRGDPMRAGEPLGMIADAIRRAAGLSGDEPIEVRRRKLRDRVGRRLGGAERDSAAEILGELVGTPFEPASVEVLAARDEPALMADQVARAWERLLSAESEALPVLLVLEDLHWGDLPTVKLVDAALRNLADRPLVVLALARPEIHEAFPRIWAQRALTEVHLGELPPRAAERLVREVLGEAIDPAGAARIVARAGGNALCLEELIRAEAEHQGDTLPESVLAMVQARLAAFDDEARRALRAASIFGLEVRPAAVAALLGDRPEAVAARLDDLAEREVLERRGVHPTADGSLFVFRHALVRDAAYESLTPADRALGHRLAAEWLERAGEREAMVIAEHHERGGRPERAAGWYRRAAEQALDADDLASALERAERGVACGAAGEELGALRRVQAEGYAWCGDLAQAEARVLDALALLPEGSFRWLRAASELMSINGNAGRAEPLIAWSQRLRALEPRDGDAVAAHALALLGAAASLSVLGRIDVADALIAHVEATAQAVVEERPIIGGRLHRARAFRFLYAGDVGGALGAYEAAARHFEAAGAMRHALNERCNVCFVQLDMGDVETAEAGLRRIIEAAERMGLGRVAANARDNLGRALALRGALDEARAVEERAVLELEAMGELYLGGAARYYLAEILAESGDIDAALREAERAIAQLQGCPPVRAAAQGVLALVLLRAGRPAPALAAAREGMDLLAAVGGVHDGESRLRRVFAEALAAAGEPEAAREAIRSAREVLLARARSISAPELRRSFLERIPENARTLLLAREWLGEGGQGTVK